MKIFILLSILLVILSTACAEKQSVGGGPTTTTTKPKTTASQATQCDEQAKYAVRTMFGKDEPIRTVSACRPNGNTYTISFSLDKKQCSHVMVRVDGNKVPTGVPSQGRCSDINRAG